eukprot:12328953-Alexandrium_andersonii.AAC.1
MRALQAPGHDLNVAWKPTLRPALTPNEAYDATQPSDPGLSNAWFPIGAHAPAGSNSTIRGL